MKTNLLSPDINEEERYRKKHTGFAKQEQELKNDN
jgi:hypothetical protein